MLDVSRLENALRSSVLLAIALLKVLSSAANIDCPLAVFLPPRLLVRLVGAWRCGLFETRELAFLMGDFDLDLLWRAAEATIAISLIFEFIPPPRFAVLPYRNAAAQLSRTCWLKRESCTLWIEWFTKCCFSLFFSLWIGKR